MSEKYIFAMHGECPKDVLTKGWLVETFELGKDPNNHNGVDLSSWDGYGAIARLNHGYFPTGTIPLPTGYQDFAIRCANFVANTQGCNHFIIGNEPNHEQEWPQGQRIHANEYVECYNLCYREIKKTTPSAHVIPAAVAPWNIQSGDWLVYFQYILDYIVDCDGIALHTYTHGADPGLIFSEQTMDAPYQDRYYHFYAYKNFMDMVPSGIKNIYITETNQTTPWLNVNQGWVRNAYREIDNWNRANSQQIKCLALYRWQYDQWEIRGRDNVILDFLGAQENDYTTGEDGMNEVFRDGFEGSYYYADDPYEPAQDVSELQCPMGWTPDWTPGTSPGINHRPEYKPRVNTPEVEFGEKCVGIHTTSASHDGVLFRLFDTVPNTKVRAEVWAMGKGDGDHGMVVGIDPTGGIDFHSPNIVWGEWWSTDVPDWIEGAWAKIFVETVALSSSITVFLRTTARIANSNAAHFDEFVLEAEGGTVPPPTGGIQDYIDALQRDLDALQNFVDSSSIKALPV